MATYARCFAGRDILQVLWTLVNNELLVKLSRQMAKTNGGKPTSCLKLRKPDEKVLQKG